MNTRQRALNRESRSPTETFDLGVGLGRSLVGGMSIGLIGPLGAGKTQFVKGIATGNAAPDSVRVTSPTFTLVQEYAGRLHLYHVDVYRLGGSAELAALGFDEFFTSDAAVVIEWADRVRGALPSDSLWVELRPTGETTRHLSFQACGDSALSCLEAFARSVD